MKSESIIKALNKNGWEVKKTVERITNHFNGNKWERILYECVSGKQKCKWYHSDDVSSVQIMNVHYNDMPEFDYFPGQHVDKIKTLIQLMKL